MRKPKVKQNEDKDLVEEIREKIKQHDGHCACAIVFNDANRCPCEEFRKMIAEGKIGEECHCGLFKIVESNE